MEKEPELNIQSSCPVSLCRAVSCDNNRIKYFSIVKFKLLFLKLESTRKNDKTCDMIFLFSVHLPVMMLSAALMSPTPGGSCHRDRVLPPPLIIRVMADATCVTHFVSRSDLDKIMQQQGVMRKDFTPPGFLTIEHGQKKHGNPVIT